MLEEVVVGWQEVRWIWQMRQNFVSQFIQLLKHWLCDVQSGIVMEKNWALFIDWCQLQAFQFSVHLISLLSILLRCNGFTGIQKVGVDQTSSRPSDSDQDLFLVQVWLWEVLWSFFWVQHWAGHCQLYKIQFLSHVHHDPIEKRFIVACRIREDYTSKWPFF